MQVDLISGGGEPVSRRRSRAWTAAAVALAALLGGYLLGWGRHRTPHPAPAHAASLRWRNRLTCSTS
ncbi:MAG: hypothetical protein M3042_06770 [Actinomycetota bacterium]|nr:hypothetical protein [Actinomycetota bacterium]